MKTNSPRCCVKGCTNTPPKGRKTCGKHGQRNNLRSTRHTHFVHLDHLDCAIPALPELTISKRPAEYRYPVIVRNLDAGMVRVNMLPTNETELGLFVAAWLNQPGHTLEDVYRLTPRTIKVWPDEYALSALALIEHDTPPPAGFVMVLGSMVMTAIAVEVPA